MPNRLHRALDATSQLLNVVLLNGDANESISGRCYREEWETAERIINCVFFWEPAHCRMAYYADVQRARDVLREYATRHGVQITDTWL